MTTYRPVPQYLAINDNMDLADLIANLIVDQIDVDTESDNERLLKLLKVLTALDDSDKPPSTNPPKISAKPGPPYLPISYLPPNSLINTPPVSPGNVQSLYQTNFDSDSQSSPALKPPKYTETYPKKFDFEQSSENIFNKMVKDLMTKKRITQKGQVKKRKKYFPTSSTKIQTNGSPLLSKKKDFTQFNRYTVNVPNGFTKNDQFSLPIDSLSSFEQILPRNSLEEDTETKNISYEEYILDLMSNLRH